MVVALIALFVSLGGSAYAALNLPKNSVGTRQLRAGAVTGSKLHNGAVTARKVASGSLLASDFKAGQLPAGPQGPQGPAGTDATVNGVAAGGDLTGAYPAPRIADGAVTAAKVAANSLTGAQIDESTLATVPDAAELGGLASSSFEQPHMAQLSLTESNAALGSQITTVGDLRVTGICSNNHPPLNDGAGVSVGNMNGGTAQVWEEHGGTADFQTITLADFDGSNPNALLATSPQVFTYEGIDDTGKLFHITAGSEYNAGACTFVAWGSSQP